MFYQGDARSAGVRQPVPASATMTTIRASTVQSRRQLGPQLTEALEDCGCWTRWRSGGVDFLCLRLELPLRSMEEFYISLMECGLELDRNAHRDLTTMCMLRRHPEVAAARGEAVELCLELTFLEESIPVAVGGA